MALQGTYLAPVVDSDVRAEPGAQPGARLDWPTLLPAFEIAALIRCGAGLTTRPSGPAVPPGPAGPAVPPRPASGPGMVAEFNQHLAAQRMVELLRVLDLPAQSATATAGLRRRYDLHRIYLPQPAARAYSALLGTAWRQGREVILNPGLVGATAARHRWRPLLGAAAWRAALMAAGRHVRRHVLGVHVADHDVGAVLVRGAQLLDAAPTLRGRSGCFLVSVPTGPDRERILRGVEVPGVVILAA